MRHDSLVSLACHHSSCSLCVSSMCITSSMTGDYTSLASPAQLQVKWDKTDEKPAVVAITTAAFVGVWALSGVVDRIDKLPVIGGLLELVGLVVTSWFVYRYLVFGPDR